MATYRGGVAYIDKQTGNIIARRFLPLELERKQGLPDNWTKYGKDGELIEDSQRYRCIGNAVSVPVVKAVGERL